MFKGADFLALQMQSLQAPQSGRSECAEEKRSTGSSDTQSTEDDSDVDWMDLASVSSSLSTMTEEAATEMHAEASQLQDTSHLTHIAAFPTQRTLSCEKSAVPSILTAQKTQVEDLQAENALLRKLLNEARAFICDVQLHAPASVSNPGEASAAASIANVDELWMQKHCSLKTVTVSLEEITTLHQKQRMMEQVIQDHVCLQRKHQEMTSRMMLLIDNIDHLKNQLSKERQRCVDAEEQRWAQKELFHRMFTRVKHDMNDKGAPLGDHLPSAAEQHVCLFNKQNTSASELLTEDKLKDATPTCRMKSSFWFPLAEDSLHYLDA